MDVKWTESWKRLGEANEREHRARLRELTVEEAYRQFEELNRAMERDHADIPPTDSHPVGLLKFWKKS
ncbi:MAG: hypothetical protein HYY93_11275 [Planctomycetes bacterium]|nr:hypothetical protein [Planctomycetota bacterium]